jgi:signal peptidase I
VNEALAARRQPWVAVVLSMFCPGLGQIYCGRLGSGLTLFLTSLGVWPVALLLAAAAPSAVAFTGCLLALLLVLGVSLYSVVDAYRVARRGTTPPEGADYDRGRVYALFILVGMTYPLGVVAYIRSNVFEAFVLPTRSMAPTFLDGDHILVNKLTYQTRPIQRGDVVVFRAPLNRQQNWIKRVIGLPGDTAAVRGGEVFVNGKKLERDRVPLSSLDRIKDQLPGNLFEEVNGGRRYLVMLGAGDKPAEDYPEKKVPEGTLFVLGDNRDQSLDSRGFGFVPLGDVFGAVQYIYWPAATWTRFGTVQE